MLLSHTELRESGSQPLPCEQFLAQSICRLLAGDLSPEQLPFPLLEQSRPQLPVSSPLATLVT